MSLNWDFEKDYLGYYILKDAVIVDEKPKNAKVNLYKGNALFIGVYVIKEQEFFNDLSESEKAHCEKQGQLICWANDSEHLKNELGINKGFDNMFSDVIKWHFERSKAGKYQQEAINNILKQLIKTNCNIEII